MMTEAQIRADERQRIASILLSSADDPSADPQRAEVMRSLARVLQTDPDELVTIGLTVIAEEVLDELVAEGVGERVVIDGEPGFRAYPNTS